MRLVQSSRKRGKFAVLTIALVAALTFSVSFAVASKGAATPFKATYTDPVEGTTHTCSGARVVQKSGVVKDSETCLVTGDTSQIIPGTYGGSAVVCTPWLGCSGWSSDYDGRQATTVTVTYVDNGNGTFTLYLVAYY
jgi:hypothetical protein